MAKLPFFLAVLIFLVILLAPNIAHLCGMAVSGLLDSHDWTPAEEELALRPIRHLIDQDQYQQALEELETALKTHNPTLEALILKAKLLYHFGSLRETAAALLESLSLSKTTQQQLLSMELLAQLDAGRLPPPRSPADGTRRVETRHPLALFKAGNQDRGAYKEIPPGIYEVREKLNGPLLWLELAGEEWGNAEPCWKAVERASPPPSGIIHRIARIQRDIAAAIAGWRHGRSAGQKFLKK
jgi:hypothetical protein